MNDSPRLSMEKEKHSTVPNSPRSTSITVNNGGTQPAAAAGAAPSLKYTPRSMDPASPSFPTTFIHADTSSFKHVVQMLTGSADTAAKSAAAPPSLASKKPAFKLYERRSNLKMLGPLVPTLLAAPSPFSPPGKEHQRPPAEISSPSMLGFPSLALSPVTQLIPDPFSRRQPNSSAAVAASISTEDRAIAEKGFYLHPSLGAAEPPRLLPLFPVTSPKMSSPT